MRRLITLALIAVLCVLATSAQEGNRIYIEDFEIEPGEMDSAQVMLTNVDPSRGLQFNISMPEGLEIVEYELTDYSRASKMNLMFDYSTKNHCNIVFIYPLGMICYPADTAKAVMCLKLKAHRGFKGGTIVTWKCCGSTMDNNTITMNGSDTHVTVPKASPIDTQPDGGQYFNPLD